VINTLSHNDYATVVAYDDYAVSYGSSLSQMSGNNRQKMKNYVDGLSIGGGTNFVAGLNHAHDILTRSISSGKTSGLCCASGSSTRLILFLTDGVNTGPDPLQVMRQWDEVPGLRVFTYSLGSGSGGSADLMKKMACSNGGVYQEIPDGGDLKEAMASYFMFLAAGIELPPVLEKATVFWSDWFEVSKHYVCIINCYGLMFLVKKDGQGLGQLAGACVPLYDRAQSSKAGVSILFGVVCTSIAKPTWDRLKDSGSVWGQIQSAQKGQCYHLDITPERMQLIRGLMPGAQMCKSSDYLGRFVQPAGNPEVKASLPGSCSYHEPKTSFLGLEIVEVIGIVLCVAGIGYILNRRRRQLKQQTPAVQSHI
jgi:hypothetical protein